MPTRRDFIKQTAILSGGIGIWESLAGPIQRALAINPEPGSSVFDAEHVVILMQENRSFDHCFGTLQGVRGFNDPRAISLANENPVWVQTNPAGESYAPFRLNIKDTCATWMGSLPHGWADQVDARNNGKYDQWLRAKRSGEKAYAAMPLTLGYYNRQDLPFYYALADAFTICDQNFCSSLTATTPNRLHLWTGTIRERQSVDAQANVTNECADFGAWVNWPTFPERLEDHGVSWKVYQNELSVQSGLSEEQNNWLANFSDNPLEFFSQYHVRFARAHREHLTLLTQLIPPAIEALKAQLAAQPRSASDAKKLQKRIQELTARLAEATAERSLWTAENFAKLPARERSLHEKAFTTNVGDPDYRHLVELAYREGNEERRIPVPKGDILDQFRADVDSGKLPAVSWLVAPERFSDHPSSAWYGAWYISEALDILTRNPTVWKKTVFILTYDENDGYFDHVPPFVAPHPQRPSTGFASKGIDTGLEYVELQQDLKRRPLSSPRESPIGLGYRVPLIVASPWSRGGCVCSQVFDHTSILRFLETFLTRKTGKPIEETNISAWRRTVCGDLTSVFQTAANDGGANPSAPPRDKFIADIHRAQFKPLPGGYKRLTPQEIEQIRRDPLGSPLLPHQESGVRPACPLPYELYVGGALSAERSQFTIQFEARKEAFGQRTAGCPFVVYAMLGAGEFATRNYAVAAGDRLEDSWRLDQFTNGVYHLRVYGPNGFFREFRGSRDDPPLEIRLDYPPAASGHVALSGNLELKAHNRDPRRAIAIELADRSYKSRGQKQSLPAGQTAALPVDTERSFRWYDVEVTSEQSAHYAQRFAGHVETGMWGFTDPAMGRTVG